MQCNAPKCGAELGLENSEFLVTSCGHAFCSTCASDVCTSARCGYCDAIMTDNDVHICSPFSRQDSQVALCGYNPSQIMTVCARALQFWDGQQILRIQSEQEKNSALEKRNSKLKGVMTEMHAKQVSAVNIMQAKIASLEKELESERFNAQTLQAKLQNEARQKRRLEEECSLLDQRRWMRNNFIATALKPQKFLQNSMEGVHSSSPISHNPQTSAALWQNPINQRSVGPKLSAEIDDHDPNLPAP